MVDWDRFERGAPGTPQSHFTAPDSRWKDPADMFGPEEADFWAYQPGKTFLGGLEGRLIGITDNRHMMTVAGSRAGKSTSAIIPNLIDYPGSVLAIDPKGELARITAHRRGKGIKFRGQLIEGLGQRVYLLDPFRRAPDWLGKFQAAFNPLDMIDPASPDAVEDAGLIADSLVIRETGSKDPHWDESALAFLEGVILHVATWADHAERRNLLTVRALVTGPRGALKSEMEANAAMAANDDDPRTIVGRAASDLFDKPENERGSVLSTVQRHTKFLDGGPMRGVLSHSDFALSDLKEDRVTIYLSLPATRLGTHARWLRLFVNLALEAMERTRATPEHPVLMILDEFASLGHMRQVEDAAAQIAGFGVKLWPVLQDLGQLKALYHERWETFMGNAGVMQFFGNNDLTTLNWLRDRLGKTTVVMTQTGDIAPGQRQAGATGLSWSPQVYPLMEADEIAWHFSRSQRAMIVICPDFLPLALDRIEYHTHPYFSGKWVSAANG